MCYFSLAEQETWSEKAAANNNTGRHHEVPASPFCGLGRQSVELIMFWPQLLVPPHCAPVPPW